MSRGWVTAALMAAMWGCAGAVQAQAAATSAFPTQRELRAIEAPPMPHEAQPERWPQPDYFQLALELTSQRAGEAAAAPRLPERGPVLAVLPVQTEAFGFAPEFRALLGAELDRLLAAHGIEALGQTDAVDVRGPTVRRFAEPAIEALLEQQPRRRLVMLHAGHDGIDRLFLTLVVRDRQAQVVRHRSLPLPPEPLAAWRAAAAALPPLLEAAGLVKAGVAPPRRADAGQACRAAHWSLEPPEASASLRQRACQALVVGTLLPDFSRAPARWPSFDARLAWLARAFVLAAADAAQDPAAAALQSLAWRQMGLETAPPVDAPADDPVLPLVARLSALPLAGRAPVQSARDARARLSAEIGRGLPAFAAAAVGYRADFVDPFGEIDLCELERLLPGAMPRAACRANGAPAAPVGGTATPAQRLLFQAWRLAAHYKELHVVARMRAQVARGEAVAAALPQDVALHPLMQRLRLEAVDAPERATSVEAQLALVRSMAERSLAATVALQRRDQWLQGWSLSEHAYTRNPVIWTDGRVQELRDDETRLLGVLRYDRFGPPELLPDRRAESEPALFLVPQRQHLAALRAQWDRVRAQRNPQAPTAAAFARSGMFGASRPPALVGALTDRLERNPLDMETRVRLGIVRLKHGAPLAEVVALFSARPENARLDDRVQESHALALPAHALFLSAEHEAARPFYERVVRTGTGSESDLHARARLQQIDGRWPQYLEEALRRQQRYDSDFARHDVAGLLFMSGRPDRAWELLEPRLATTDVLYLWNAVQVGHRLEGAGLAQARSWIDQRKLGQVQIRSTVIDRHYLHLMAVVDRLPSDADIPLLLPHAGVPVSSGEYRWSVSALLTQAALGVADPKAVLQRSRLSLSPDNGDRQRFLLPNFAWVAWKASQGQDAVLDEVRRADLDADFDGLIAKAMVMALDGRVAESMQFMAAARFELSLQGTSSVALLDRAVPAPYQYALAGYLMHRQTGREEYRRETLRYVRAQQHLQPFYAWLHGIEAALETAPAARTAAACRARALDAGSYFLAQAAVPGLDDRRCKADLWQASSR